MPAPEPTKSQILMAELMAQNELASLVRDAVIKSGLDRQGIAQRLGVHKSNISRVLNNPRNMTVRLAARILRAAGQRIVYASVPATATNYQCRIVYDGGRSATTTNAPPITLATINSPVERVLYISPNAEMCA